MIIGLTGKKQNGKSTAATYIAEKYGFVRLNFKDALVAEIKERFPNVLEVIIEMMDRSAYDGMNPWTVDRLFKDKPPVFRALMQNFGTEVRRRDHEDYWVVKWLKQVQKIDNVVVDDVRFLNEAQAVTDMGGHIVRIIRDDYVNTDTHVSESEMNFIVPDYTIAIKTGEQEILYRELDNFILSKKV
jgi:hypothetical protein